MIKIVNKSGEILYRAEKRAGRGTDSEPLALSNFNVNLHPELPNTPTLGGKNLVKIGSGVRELWLPKLKSRGPVYLSKRVFGTIRQGQLYIASNSLTPVLVTLVIITGSLGTREQELASFRYNFLARARLS